MEVIKHSAVDYFFERLATPREEIYKKFIPIARAARSCYVDVSAFAGITDDEFFSMMFVDAIFLVQFIGSLGSDHRLDSMVSPYLVGITRDMMLLENQIPWLVVQFFMALSPSPLSLEQIVQQLILWTGLITKEPLVVDLGESFKPSHLLCLLRSYRAGRSGRRRVDPRRFSAGKVTTSAGELTKMGIELRAGKTTANFSGMDLVKGPLFAHLSLVPLYLESVTACWLVNMAALETYTESATMGDDCSINSYLAFVSSLMNREQDVRELRARGIVDGFSDQHTLDFFEGLSQYLTPGHVYLRTMLDIQEYKKGRWLWIAVYRFLHSNWKTIATVLPVVSVLVGILKTLLSLKQHTS
ncbi:UPF0481 protein At3g47200-like [Miscanthus floridulus]|uniref:UPF0481 protein At3g47200-like n=1 Tax=Miscanthus floridulus TaxID=154761 RepID=UPI003457AD83